MNTPCKACGGNVDRSKRGANNKKYCSVTCRNNDPENKRKTREKWTKNNRARHNKQGEGRMQCYVCGGWYHRPITHARQRHGVNADEYKEHAGLERGKGVLSEASREKSREAVYENYETVVKKNLIEKGVATRFKEGDPTIGKYKRRPETLKRLREHIINIGK